MYVFEKTGWPRPVRVHGRRRARAKGPRHESHDTLVYVNINRMARDPDGRYSVQVGHSLPEPAQRTWTGGAARQYAIKNSGACLPTACVHENRAGHGHVQAVNVTGVPRMNIERAAICSGPSLLDHHVPRAGFRDQMAQA